MAGADEKLMLLFFVLLIVIIVSYRVNIQGIGERISHLWPPFIVVMSILALLLFSYLVVKNILHFSY